MSRHGLVVDRQIHHESGLCSAGGDDGAAAVARMLGCRALGHVRKNVVTRLQRRVAGKRVAEHQRRRAAGRCRLRRGGQPCRVAERAHAGMAFAQPENAEGLSIAEVKYRLWNE
jgi:hypothetical protein